MTKRMRKQAALLLLLIPIIFSSSIVSCTSKEAVSPNNNHTAVTTANEAYVVRINGHPVLKPEFMTYLYETQLNFETIGGADIWETDFDGETAEKVAKDSALNALKMVKITISKAKELGISLTDDELEKAKADAVATMEELTPEIAAQIGISAEEMERVMAEKTLYTKVYMNLTSNFVLSEGNLEEFNAYYETNKDSYMNDFIQYRLETILVKDYKTAEEVSKRAKAGEDFTALSKKYEIEDNAKETTGFMEIYKGQLESTLDITFDLETGEISDALDTSKGYYVFKVLQKENSTESQVKEFALQTFKASKEQQFFSQEYNKWDAASTMERNDAVWDSITLIQ